MIQVRAGGTTLMPRSVNRIREVEVSMKVNPYHLMQQKNRISAESV